MIKIKHNSFLLICFIEIIFYTNSFSQTLNGMEGVLTIPSAYMNKDATIAVGAGYLNKKENPFTGYTVDAYTYTAWFTFLPFFEAGGRILRNVGRSPSEGQGIGDRTISLRLQLLSGEENLPAILIGIQNIGPVYGGWVAAYDQSTYAVASKKYNLSNFLRIKLHLGYGLDAIKARNHKFKGVFGGSELNFDIIDEISITGLFEYDAEKMNAGTRMIIWDRVHLIISYFDLKYFGGGFGFKFVI